MRKEGGMKEATGGHIGERNGAGAATSHKDPRRAATHAHALVVGTHGHAGSCPNAHKVAREPESARAGDTVGVRILG